ncbi:MAG: arginine--tRNA ligase [Candidatus Margulisiibacteriota bacterium]
MRSEIVKIIEKATGLKDITLESPKEKAHGDFSLNIAMMLAKQEKKPPREVALKLKKKIENADKSNIFSKIEIAGPGFINLFINERFVRKSFKKVLEEKENFGKNNIGENKKVLVEFVSANPTGPLHIGHGRWAAIGDSLARILVFCGWQVCTEFYVNNVGRQVNLLIESVKSAMDGRPVPEDGYNGAYIKDIAEEVRFKKPADLRGFVLNKLLAEQKATLAALSVYFDNWFFENTLHNSGSVRKTVDLLIERDATYEKDGAVWFKSESYGDDKDRVLMRENGEPTYFSADIAYHADKFRRGFDLLVNVWGTDHHGYVKRLQSALEALGLPSQNLEIIIGQLVALYRGKEQVRMSKRTGDMITLKEVIDEIGADAARFFLVMTGADTHMDFDLELAKKKTLDNPVYYVQYAHARVCNIIKNSNMPLPDPEDADLSLLAQEAEKDLMLKILELPEELKLCARTMQPHHLARYAREFAAVLHSYYHKCRVICDEPKLMKSRLVLMEASRIVLSNMLKLLGVSAPERM